MSATFSASTCISSNNTSPGPFNIYLDSDYTSTPFSSATLSQLTNCPFVIVVPTGTTSLGFKDIILNYCFEITIQDNNICSNCNLGLSNYSSSTITQLSCGILTGTCQNINDYVIKWYGPNDTTTLSFTSGAGSFLTTGMIPHPFLNNNSIPLPEGVYTPVIEKIKVSGITFSNTGGTNNVLFSGNCLPSTTILPLSCSNQTNPSLSLPYSAYNHYISYEFLNGNVPTPVNLTYKLSSSTQFFAWRFKGSNNPDRITIKFSGSSYGTNILGLEDVVVGSNNNINNYNSTIFPKSASTPNFFIKLTCLTGLTVNNNDNILITITPGTSETIWELYSTCLTNYDCTSCLFTNPYKIIGSTITGVTSSCSTKIKFSISGCNNSSYLSSDLYKYYMDVSQTALVYQFPYSQASTNLISLDGIQYNPVKFISADFFSNQNICKQEPTFILTSNCATDTNNIRYQKTFVGGVGSKGVFNITGSSTVISTYYNSWINAKTNYSGSSSTTNANYYRYFIFKIPSQTTPNNCLENVSFTTVTIHPSSTVTTGLTSSGNYYFRLTAETISNNFSSTTTCDIDCLNISTAYVNSINNNSTGVTNNYDREFIYTPNTNNFGVYYTNPFYVGYTLSISNQTLSAQTISGRLYTNQWTTNTIPYSGISNTLIPSFSGTLCNYNTLGGVISPTYNSFYNDYNLYYYYIRTLNLNDFEIWSAPIISYSGNTDPNNAILAYRYSGGNVTYSSSTYIIG